MALGGDNYGAQSSYNTRALGVYETKAGLRRWPHRAHAARSVLSASCDVHEWPCVCTDGMCARDEVAISARLRAASRAHDDAHAADRGSHGQTMLAVQSTIPVTRRTASEVAAMTRQAMRRAARGSSMLSFASASSGRRSGSAHALDDGCRLVSCALWLASCGTAASSAPGSSGGDGGSERSDRSELKLARARERRDGGRTWCVGRSEVIIRPPWPGEEGERRRCVRGGDVGAKVTGIGQATE